MIKKLFFLFAAILITTGRVEPRSIWRGASQQQKIDQIFSLVKKNVRHTPIALATGNDYSAIIIIIVFCFLILLIWMWPRSSATQLEPEVMLPREFLFLPSEPKVSLPDSSIEPFFMPHEGHNCTKSLHQDLQNAKQNIHIASYWITHCEIIRALRMARKRNVLVEIIFDKSTPGAAILQREFRDSGIKFTESEVNSALMHHKFIIVDNNITWVGSANLTWTAFSENYENMIRIESPEIAQRYLIDFKDLMNEFSKSVAPCIKIKS